MGWEIKDNRFFCNTSDTFFGPYLDGWPDDDDELFHKMFNLYLSNNPQRVKRQEPEADPRGMTSHYLEKLCGSFEEDWDSLECAAEKLVEFAEENDFDAVQLLIHLSAREKLDFSKVAKKKVAKKKRISGWSRYEFVEGNSNKFWEVKKIGKKYSVRHGRIGSAGRTIDTQMKSGDEAAQKVASMIDSKLRKGYLFALRL